ncbi:MAG: NUDIX domain-containing protein [Bacteriovoracaceae bacterium]|jgi:mutator protein MutT|nr:NUDIX domain-containing protein [Bacteriovoracaceae bacterium]
MKDKLRLISLVLPFSKKEKCIWLQKRSTADELEGLLEIPGGKVEINEEPIHAALRELKEEVGVEKTIDELELIKIHSHSKDPRIIFYVYLLDCNKEEFCTEGWFKVSKIKLLEANIPPENVNFLYDIIENL